MAKAKKPTRETPQKPKVIFVDDILKNYTNFEKVSKVYQRIRKEVIKGNPIQNSPLQSVEINHTNRIGNYQWELYSTDDYEVMIETMGRWTGYGTENNLPPKMSENPTLNMMRLTFHRDKIGIASSIEKILKDFPKD